MHSRKKVKEMKRFLLLCMFLLMLSFFAFCKEIQVSSSKCYIGDVSDINIFGEYGLSSLTLSYDDQEDKYLLYLASDVRFELTNSDFSIFQKTVEKSIDWKRIASSNNVSIIKELPDSRLCLTYCIKDHSTGGWKKSDVPADLTFIFKANPAATNWIVGDFEYYGIYVSGVNPEYNVKAFSVRDMTIASYDYRDTSEKTLTSLKTAIAKSSIDAAIKNANKQANADDLFI